MGESKITHSPGPWQHRHGAIIAADGQIVAQYFTTPDYQDASMIIAAPDMYEAHSVNQIDLALLMVAVQASDPKDELEMRVGDILKRTVAALARAEART